MKRSARTTRGGIAFLLTFVLMVTAALALSGTAAADPGMQCVPTGMETVATDKEDYPPGETVHVTGVGYAPACDVEVQIERPDGVVEAFSASTDLVGSFALDYLLPGPPGVIGEYRITVRGLDGATLASMTFTDAAGAIEVVSAYYPAPSPAGQERQFTVLGRVLAAPSAGAKCVRLTLPSGFAIVSGSQSFEVGAGSGWTLALNNVGGTARQLLLSTSSAGNTGLPGSGTTNWARFDFRATTPASHTSPPWDLTFADNAACSSNPNTVQAGVRIANENNQTYAADFRDEHGAVVSPSATPGGPAQTFRLRIANTSGASGDKISYAGLALPKCFANPTGVSVTTSNGGRPDFTFELRDRFIRLLNGELEKDQNPDEFVQVTFTSSASASCSSSTHSFWTSAWKSSPTSSSASDNFNIVGNHPAAEAAAANTAPSVAYTTAPATANEGETKTYNFSITDPDAGDTFAFVSGFPKCGTGGTLVSGSASIDSTAKTGTFQCSFPDGPATPTVEVRVQDSAAAQSNTASQAVAVANVTPTVAFTDGPTAVDESGTAERTYTFSVSDPGADTFEVLAGYPSCGVDGLGNDGVLVSGSLSTNAGGGSFKCRFPDGPSTLTVEIKVEDSDDAPSNEATRTVTVSNVAPTVAFTDGPTAVAESGMETHSYGYSISDPGADAVLSVATECGPGGVKVVDSDVITNTSGSFKCTFPDGPATPVVSAQATDSDDEAGNTATRGVTVANVAPTVTFNAELDTAVAEGSSHTYSYTISDPGDDEVTSVAVSCGAAGVLVDGSSTEDDVSGSFECKFPDGPANSTLTAQATDSDGEAGATATLLVSVSNVAPKVDLIGATQVEEGDTRTYTYTVDDPGDDTYSVDDFSCGDEGVLVVDSLEEGPEGGNFKCRFPDGNATTTVLITVSDEDGASTEDSHDVVIVEIANVAPKVTFDADLADEVLEGSTHNYSYTIDDPGDDDVASVNVNCGASGTISNATNDDDGGSFDCNFPDGPAGSTVSAQATDSDGAAGNTATLEVTVANVAPTLTFHAGLTTEADEGSTHTYTYSIADPGVDTVTSVAVSCGTAGTVSNATNTDTGGSFQCTFPEGPASSTVSAQATDSDGEAGNTAEVAVTVKNLAPSVTITTPSAGSLWAAGNPITVSATFTDAGRLDTHTCTINGAPGTVTEANGSGTCQGTATPTSPGSFTITVVVTDDDGASGSDSVTGFGLYAVYAHERCSGGFGKGLIVNGANADVDGLIHSNGYLTLDGVNFNSYSLSLFRSSTNNCKATFTSKNVNFGEPSPKAPVLESTARDWPRYFNRSEFTCTYPVKEEYIFNKAGQEIPPGVYCATKVFKINASNVSGKITVLAPEIQLNGKNINIRPHTKDMLLFNVNPANGSPSTKEIVLDPADVLRGMIFNPGGGIKVNGKSARIVNGFLHGQWVEVNLAGFRMEYSG